MNERDSKYLDHIAKAIQAIDGYLTNVTRETFNATPMIRDAVLRNLEVISEASRRVSDELKNRNPGVPWTAIRDAGNVYRHAYDTVDDDIVWETATAGLATLRDFLQRELPEP